MSAPGVGPQVITELMAILKARKSADPASSYVAGLYSKGVDTILKKVGEEAAETIIAAKGADRAALIHELADLWFHTLVLMAAYDLPLDDLMAELASRMGRSGLDEKASRKSA